MSHQSEFKQTPKQTPMFKYMVIRSRAVLTAGEIFRFNQMAPESTAKWKCHSRKKPGTFPKPLPERQVILDGIWKLKKLNGQFYLIFQYTHFKFWSDDDDSLGQMIRLPMALIEYFYSLFMTKWMLVSLGCTSVGYNSRKFAHFIFENDEFVFKILENADFQH